MSEHGITKLTEYQHVRLRTEMYAGSRTPHEQEVLLHTETGPVIKNLTWVPATFTCFREAIDNCLDEFTKAGINGILKVEFDESELKFTISDNGRGIPIDYSTQYNQHLSSMVLSELKAGRNFDDSERNGVSGQNGMGISIVTNVSSYFEVEIIRDGKPQGKRKGTYKFKQKFSEGNYVDDSLQVFDPEIKSTKSTSTGTTCEFKLSEEVFKHRELPTELIYSLLREIAATNIQHSIYFNGKKINVKAFPHKTLFDSSKPMTYHVNEEGFDSKYLIIPNICPEGMMMHSLVNNIPTFDGGSHLEEFKKSFFLGMNKALTKESKRRKLSPNRSDIEEGILVYNITKMNAPYFGSQSKSKLINDEIRKPITSGLTEDFFADIIKSNKAWIDSIYERCAERTHKKDAADINREAKKALKKKVAKLRDATAKRGKDKLDRSECSLFLCEGACLEENTLVRVLRDGNFIDILIKDIEEFDIVITDKNRLKSVVSVSKSVQDTIEFNTSSGIVSMSPEHKMLVLEGDEFKYIKADDINTENHKFVKSQLFENIELCNINSIGTSDVYDISLDIENYDIIHTTLSHRFGVFDWNDNTFKMIEAKDIDLSNHAFVLKK